MTEPPDHPSETFLLTCMECRYRLRGLSPDGACPECGTPIARSIEWRRELAARKPWWLKLGGRAGPLLREADARWLRRLLAGTLALAATWVFVGAWLVARRLLSPRSYVPDFALAAIGAWYFASAWLATWGERRPDVPLRWDAVRWAIRLAAGGTCLATWLALRAELVPAGEFWRFSSVAMIVGMLCIPAAAALTLIYLGHLAGRVPDDWAAGSFRIMGWTVVVVTVAPCCLAGERPWRAVSQYRYEGSPNTLGGFLDNVAVACGGIGYAFYAFILLLLLRLAYDLGRCAATARR